MMTQKKRGRNPWFLFCLVFFICVLPILATGKGEFSMKMESTQFTDSEMIPLRYTCDGQDISPPLSWRNAPAETRVFALICDDPDAPGGTWVHWVAYDIPPDLTGLDEHIKPDRIVPNGMVQGTNSWGKIGYGGPCPPGGTHRYFFKLYALDKKLDLKPGLNKDQLLKAMAGHVLAEAQVMGKYRRIK